MTAPSIRAAELWRACAPVLGLCAALLARSGPVQAQPAERGDAALAEGLFQDARQLFDQGQYAEACPKLAESQRLDPAGGTILLLGLCYEAQGRWASAWATFNEATGVAIKDGRADREQRARERLAVVEGKMTRLRLQLPPSLSALPGLSIRRDEQEIPSPAWTSALPVDPGRHALRVSARGKLPWTAELTTPTEGGLLQVQLPASLQDEAPSPALPLVSSSPPSREAPAPRGHTLAYGVGAAGLVGLGLGAVFGVRALSRGAEADRRCPLVRCGDAGAVQLSSDARSAALVSNVAFAAGAAGVGAGLLLFFLDRPAKPAAAASPGLRLAPAPLGQGGRLAGGWLNVEGNF